MRFSGNAEALQLGPVYSETCVFETRFMRHYNVCYKMMEKGRKMWDVSSPFSSPSFYNIHCSDAWNAFQTHTFHCRRPLNIKLPTCPRTSISSFPVSNFWPLLSLPWTLINIITAINKNIRNDNNDDNDMLTVWIMKESILSCHVSNASSPFTLNMVGDNKICLLICTVRILGL